jgi:hypothetical protein
MLVGRRERSDANARDGLAGPSRRLAEEIGAVVRERSRAIGLVPDEPLQLLPRSPAVLGELAKPCLDPLFRR